MYVPSYLQNLFFICNPSEDVVEKGQFLWVSPTRSLKGFNCLHRCWSQQGTVALCYFLKGRGGAGGKVKILRKLIPLVFSWSSYVNPFSLSLPRSEHMKRRTIFPNAALEAALVHPVPGKARKQPCAALLCLRCRCSLAFLRGGCVLHICMVFAYHS